MTPGSRSTIACVGAGLGAGGSERVLATLAGRWAERGHRVTVVTIDGGNGDFFSLPPRVDRVALGLAGSSTNPIAAGLANLKRIAALRVALRRVGPSTVVSFGDQTNVLTLLAARGLGARIVVSERTDPTRHSIGRPWEILRMRVYPWSDALVVQTNAVSAWARGLVPRDRVVVIENPLSDRFTGSPEVPSDKRRLTIAALGRLGPEKGFDLLIEAFARIAGRYPDWTVEIIGTGRLQAALREQAERLAPGRVIFSGLTRHPEESLSRTAVFALPSRREGFPNALAEAMACGAAVVAADCSSGPRELIDHGKTGLLVPPESVDALSDALAALLGDANLRARLGTTARAVVRERLALDRIADAWERLFAQESR